MQSSAGDGSTGRGDDRARTRYDLFAVCNHIGRMGFGHYTTYAREWADMYATGDAVR